MIERFCVVELCMFVELLRSAIMAILYGCRTDKVCSKLPEESSETPGRNRTFLNLPPGLSTEFLSTI